MSKQIYLIFVALFGVAIGELADFSQCPDYLDNTCEVTEVRITPCKNRKNCRLKKGAESAIHFDFIPKFSTNSMTTSLFWDNPAGDVAFPELHFSLVDACKYTKCPTVAGEKQEFQYSLRLSKKLPSGTYTFKWKLWDSGDESKMCCFKTVVSLRR